MAALSCLAAAVVAVQTVPLGRLRAFIERRRVTARRGDDWPRAVRRAMNRAARTIPGSTCLARALAAEWLLRGGGHDALLTIGVARGQGASLDAHAWVESGGVVVAGDDQLGRYQPLATFDTRAR